AAQSKRNDSPQHDRCHCEPQEKLLQGEPGWLGHNASLMAALPKNHAAKRGLSTFSGSILTTQVDAESEKVECPLLADHRYNACCEWSGNGAFSFSRSRLS